MSSMVLLRIYLQSNFIKCRFVSDFVGFKVLLENIARMLRIDFFYKPNLISSECLFVKQGNVMNSTNKLGITFIKLVKEINKSQS